MWLVALGVLTLFASAAWGINRIATQSAVLSDLRVSEVRLGHVDNTINASGIVIPVREEQISSPAQTRITKIVAKAGQTVKAGELLMVLDDQAVRVAIDNLREQISQQDIRVQTLSSELEAQLKNRQ